MPSSTSQTSDGGAETGAEAAAETFSVHYLSSTRTKIVKITPATRTPQPSPSKSKQQSAKQKKKMIFSPMINSEVMARSAAAARRARRSQKEVYFVEKIVGIRMVTSRSRNGARVTKPYFKVKWWDFPMSECTWEPYRNLGQKCDSYIEDYRKSMAKKQAAKVKRGSKR